MLHEKSKATQQKLMKYVRDLWYIRRSVLCLLVLLLKHSGLKLQGETTGLGQSVQVFTDYRTLENIWSGLLSNLTCLCCCLQSRRTSFCPIDEKPDNESAEDSGKMAVVFSLKNEVGCLVKALRLFQVREPHPGEHPYYLIHIHSQNWQVITFITARFFLNIFVCSLLPLPLHLSSILFPLLQEKRVNLNHIESRMSKRIHNEVEIFASCKCSKKEFNELLEHLKDNVNILSFNTPVHVWSAEAGTNTLKTCNNMLKHKYKETWIWLQYS